MTPPSNPTVAEVPSFPPGLQLTLGRGVRLTGNRLLLGGSPTMALLLSPAAAALLQGGRLEVRPGAAATLGRLLLDRGLAHPDPETLPASREGLTVVVPIRDRPTQLDRLLHSVPSGVPVIVVDDASLHGPAVAAVARRRGATLIRCPENAGPAAARNAGLRAVTTPLVAFVDSDVVLAPGCLESLAAHLSDPTLAVAVPRIVALHQGGEAGWVGRYEAARSSLDLGPDPALVRPLSSVSWAASACLAARVERLGSGFDPSLRVGEDVDLVWRLAASGQGVRYVPTAHAQHDHRTGLVSWARRKYFYGTGAGQLTRRHPANMAPAVLAPWGAALASLALAQHRLSLPLMLGLAARVAWRIRGKLPGAGVVPARTLSAAAARLAGQGALNSLGQLSALLLRHAWPVACLLLPWSKRTRRAVLVAGILDAAVEYAKSDKSLDPLRFALLRRLDDFAYGAGVWVSCLRTGALGALLPRVTRGTRPVRPPRRASVRQ